MMIIIQLIYHAFEDNYLLYNSNIVYINHDYSISTLKNTTINNGNR